MLNRIVRLGAVALALSVSVAAAGGCSSHQSGPVVEETALGDAPFVAVPRAPGSRSAKLAAAPAAAARLEAQGAGGSRSGTKEEDFYLAIRKDELDKKWFLSAFMKQYFPGAVASGAARSLGTRVVTFKVQNDRLYVFDADDRRQTSGTFKPELLVEAYPIIAQYPAFFGQPNASQYVLIDPSAGLNDFGVVSDTFGAGGAQFKIDLTYLQRFRSVADGVTFEQVFTGTGDTAGAPLDPTAPLQTEENPFRASGTLGIALRRYQESPGFTNIPYPEKEHFFRSDLRLVKDQGTTVQNPVKWNIYPGMAPIKWLISDQILVAAAKYPQYDIVGAVKKGITNWNAVFGFTVFEAEVGSADDSWADDDVNMVIWDNDPTNAYAFANWRSNPNTGEIRGASVYMNAIWIRDSFTDDVATSPTPAQRTSTAGDAALPVPHFNMLAWGGMPETPVCAKPAAAFGPGSSGEERRPANAPLLTKKQKAENYITHTVLHEVGHDLGLRHNFKGTLVSTADAPSSSVMDYVPNDESIYMTTPGSYDVAALNLLYKGGAAPTDPFCTDPGTSVDVYCNQFDKSPTPLTSFFAPLYRGYLEPYLSGQSTVAPDNSLNGVLQFVRAGTSSAEKLTAWNTVIQGFAAPLTTTQLATPGYGARADLMARRLYSRLFLDAPAARGRFTMDPSTDPQVTPLMLADMKGNLVNVDGVRTFQTRRVIVDVLKKMQTAAAFVTLREARATIAAARVAAGGEEAAQLDDLLARIDRAVGPYFN